MKITFERALEVLEAMGYELEQPEQEPVAWGCKTIEDFLIFQNEKQANLFAGKWELKVTPLYAAPVSIEAAVLAEREACAKVCDDIGDSDNGYGCAAAIRARNVDAC